MPDLESTTPAPEAQPAPAETTTPTPRSDDFDSLPESWQTEIKSLRKESADRRSKLSAFEKAEEDRKIAALSDIEKAHNAAKIAADRATALEAKLIDRDAIAALEKANLIDAELGLLAIRSKIEVKDGEAMNLEDLIAELIKSKPHLVKSTAPVSPIAPDTRPTSPAAKPQDTAPRSRVWGKI